MNGVQLGLNLADYIAFFAYFIALFGIGAVVARKKKANASDYFLAGQSLPWYVVGSSYIAANISTEHFIGMIGAAVVYGICVATQEWSTVIAFTFLIWIFIPFLLTSKVYTAPEFLERRFNRNVRFIFALVTILANIVAFMGPVIYGGGLILVELFNMNSVAAAIIIGILAGVMAIIGGLKSIAFMDLLTIIVMVFGGLTVTFLGLHFLGDGEGLIKGFSEMVRINLGEESWSREWIANNVPNILKSAEEGAGYNRMSVLQPLNHYTNPWTHWVLSFFYIGLWYTAINQHMIQKVFAAKDMYHARMGMVFASFLKLLLPFIVVVPGLIYFAMRPDFLMTGDWNIISDESNKTYIVLINQLVPIFMKGILLAALFGAIQSTVSSVLNSTSTVFTMDFYKEYFRKDASEKEEIMVGRVSGTIILAISIGIAIVLATAKVNLFVFIQALYSFIAPPFSAIFLLGMLWRKVNGKDAFITILASFGLSFLLKFVEFSFLHDKVMEAYALFVDGQTEAFKITFANLSGSQQYFYGWFESLSNKFGYDSIKSFAGIVKPFAMQALITWVFAMIVCSIRSYISPAPDPSQVGDGLVLNFKKLATVKGGLGTKWYNSVTLWWALAFAMMIGFIIIFGIIL